MISTCGKGAGGALASRGTNLSWDAGALGAPLGVGAAGLEIGTALPLRQPAAARTGSAARHNRTPESARTPGDLALGKLSRPPKNAERLALDAGSCYRLPAGLSICYPH